MDAADVVINVAYVGLVSAAFLRPVLLLRMALLAAAVLFVIFGIITDIPSMVVWNSIIAVLHLRMIAQHLQTRKNITLTPHAQQVHKSLFSGLSVFDFQSLWAMGETTAYDGGSLAVAGDTHGMLAVILDGTAHVYRDGSVVNELTTGALVGELSYVSGQPASADVVASGLVHVRQWDHQTLQMLADMNPSADRALHAAIARDVTAKLVG